MEYLQRKLISSKQGDLIYIYGYIQYLHIIIHISLKWPLSTICLSWILSVHKSVCLFLFSYLILGDDAIRVRPY